MNYQYYEMEYNELQGQLIKDIQAQFDIDNRTQFEFKRPFVTNVAPDPNDNTKIYSLSKEYVEVGRLSWQNYVKLPLVELDLRELIWILRAIELQEGDWN
jgi:hypothetical protein